MRQEIVYGTVACSLGQLLVASTKRGICAIALGESQRQLLASLREQRPSDTLRADAGALAPWLERVSEFVARPREAAGLGALALDLQGTQFQLRVWQAIRAVPIGAVLTYAQLAQRVGITGGARAVGAACAANRIALAIPCHRVVGSNGALAGYRWGTRRKQELLAREGAVRGGVALKEQFRLPREGGASTKPV